MELSNNKLALKRLYSDNHILEEELKYIVAKDFDNLERCSIISKIVSHKIENLLEIEKIDNEINKKTNSKLDFIKIFIDKFKFFENKK